MSGFVEECRREWRRLRVPDAVANEMAADLTADLAEAEAEGASIEDVLGNSAFDPRSFAAAWAGERAVSRPPAASAGSPSRWLWLAAVAAFGLALVGALMVMVPTVSTSGALVVPRHLLPGPPAGVVVHGSTVANHVHALGGLLLIVGIVATIATLLWIWRSRGPRASGWSTPSAPTRP